MSSFVSGHGEPDAHQHLIAFALMFLAVAAMSVTIIVSAHRVTPRNADREPPRAGAEHCRLLGGGERPIRYCVDP